MCSHGKKEKYSQNFFHVYCMSQFRKRNFYKVEEVSTNRLFYSIPKQSWCTSSINILLLLDENCWRWRGSNQKLDSNLSSSKILPFSDSTSPSKSRYLAITNPTNVNLWMHIFQRIAATAQSLLLHCINFLRIIDWDTCLYSFSCSRITWF